MINLVILRKKFKKRRKFCFVCGAADHLICHFNVPIEKLKWRKNQENGARNERRWNFVLKILRMNFLTDCLFLAVVFDFVEIVIECEVMSRLCI